VHAKDTTASTVISTNDICSRVGVLLVVVVLET
jgi:hypothetical protein